ncbi:ABC transporter permease [Anaerocellum danielii]|uniref:ABC transporter permease n=1 Tax=Anaerocellum danielii TaxID=1387557 RepID=A0ABZ0TZD8_9FIRM|nr:ABC transporter permease [Caldicellulosiruptor danielii]WPX08587.1 ABC transporter permease [Caldicellulosiruptor danielii]
MAILKLNLKRLLKDPINLFFIVLIPIFTLIMISFFSIGKQQKLQIGIVSEGNDAIAKSIEEKLSSFCDITKVDSRKIKYELIFNSLDCVVELPQNLTEKIYRGEKFIIKIHSFSKTGYYIQIKNRIETALSIYWQLARTSKSEKEFLNRIKKLTDAQISFSFESSDKDQIKNRLAFILGFFVLSLLSISLNSTAVILKDKEEGTLVRIFTATIKPKSYVLQVLVAVVLVALIQVGLYFAIAKMAFGKDLFLNIRDFTVATVMCILLFVSLSMSIITFIKDKKQLSVLMPVIMTVLPMLGGCYWPLEIMPNFMQKISLLVPTTYAMNVLKEVLILGTGLFSVRLDLIAVALFSVVFVLISIKGFSKNVLGRM